MVFWVLSFSSPVEISPQPLLFEANTISLIYLFFQRCVLVSGVLQCHYVVSKCRFLFLSLLAIHWAS